MISINRKSFSHIDQCSWRDPLGFFFLGGGEGEGEGEGGKCFGDRFQNHDAI